MKKVYMSAEVDDSKCIGDRICQNICPAGAIEMKDKKAFVDTDKCVTCLTCIDACSEGAIATVPRKETKILHIDPLDVDQGALEMLCRDAHLDPEEPICLCTLTQAKEVAAAILKGAGTPQELTRMTGIRSSCSMWCMAPMLRLLQASGADLTPPKSFNWYPAQAGIWEIPDHVVRQYKEYSIAEDRRLFEQGVMDNLVSKLK
jgi:Fe-S-cluster-containing hydrogenase component 2